MDTLLNVAPFALVAVLCPLMMWFMMRGMHHGSDQEHHHPGDDDETRIGGRQ
jgi:hypothetical protein